VGGSWAGATRAGTGAGRDVAGSCRRPGRNPGPPGEACNWVVVYRNPNLKRRFAERKTFRTRAARSTDRPVGRAGSAGFAGEGGAVQGGPDPRDGFPPGGPGCVVAEGRTDLRSRRRAAVARGRRGGGAGGAGDGNVGVFGAGGIWTRPGRRGIFRSHPVGSARFRSPPGDRRLPRRAPHPAPMLAAPQLAVRGSPHAEPAAPPALPAPWPERRAGYFSRGKECT
jgi:hypothetical protein